MLFGDKKFVFRVGDADVERAIAKAFAEPGAEQIATRGSVNAIRALLTSLAREISKHLAERERVGLAFHATLESRLTERVVEHVERAGVAHTQADQRIAELERRIAELESKGSNHAEEIPR